MSNSGAGRVFTGLRNSGQSVRIKGCGPSKPGKDLRCGLINMAGDQVGRQAQIAAVNRIKKRPMFARQLAAVI